MDYYTAKQARRVLGDISANKLKKYVDSGILNRYPPPGGKQGLYSKEEVDALRTELLRFYGAGRGKEEDRDGRGTIDHPGRSPSFAS